MFPSSPHVIRQANLAATMSVLLETDIHGMAHNMRKKILLVEDNEDNRDLVSFVVKSARLDVELLSAENGEQGVEIAFAHVPDLILMDMEMPVLDGWAAVPMLRADTRTAAVPIVALTARARPEDKQRTKEIGCIEHMSKPVVPDELIGLVKRYLQI